MTVLYLDHMQVIFAKIHLDSLIVTVKNSNKMENASHDGLH